MIPEQWAPPCNSQCTRKYSALMQIPWRVFCKKGCDADGETWDECLGECDEICYKDPVLKDKQWSAYIDRSPGSASYSEECFRACVAGCSYKFEIPPEKIEQVHSRSPKPPQPPLEEKPNHLDLLSYPVQSLEMKFLALLHSANRRRRNNLVLVMDRNFSTRSLL